MTIIARLLLTAAGILLLIPPPLFAGPEKLTPDQAVLEEYKMVREEINLCLQNRFTVLSLGFAALGAILAGGVTVASGDKPRWFISALIIGVGANLTSLYICNLWIEETQRLQRASYHNYYLESKLQDLTPGQPMPIEWEHRVRTKPYQNILPTDSGTPKLFLEASGAFAACGFMVFAIGMSHPHRRYRRWIIAGVVIVGSLLWYYRGFAPRSRQMQNLENNWSLIPLPPAQPKTGT